MPVQAFQQDLSGDESAPFGSRISSSGAHERRINLLSEACHSVNAFAGTSVLLKDDFSPVDPLAICRVSRHVFQPLNMLDIGGDDLLSTKSPVAIPFVTAFSSAMFSPTTLSRREMVDDQPWYSSPFARHRRTLGLDDLIISAVPLPDRKPFVGLIVLSRALRTGQFTERDAVTLNNLHFQARHYYYEDIESYKSATAWEHSPATANMVTAPTTLNRVASLFDDDMIALALKAILAGADQEHIAKQFSLTMDEAQRLVGEVLADFRVSDTSELRAIWAGQRTTASRSFVN